MSNADLVKIILLAFIAGMLLYAMIDESVTF
jgi:hypothetical protein